ncbi:MAG: ankyrin repeat domain-containing protein [Candidatus Berkiella sp.]
MNIPGFLIELYELIGAQQKAEKFQHSDKKSKAIIDAAVKEARSKTRALLDKYKAELSEEQFLSLQRCLKVFNIPFADAENLELLKAPYYGPKSPNETFRNYFNDELYQKAYALSDFVYLFEQNGIPAEHATKIAVIFNDTDSMMHYLNKIAISAQNTQKFTQSELQNVYHDAFLFSLPEDVLASGFNFSLWKDLANKGKSQQMMNSDFKALLPFGWHIQQLVSTKENESKETNTKPDDEKIKSKSKELQKLIQDYKSLERKKAILSVADKKRYQKIAGLVSEAKRELAKLCYGKPLKDLTLLEIIAFYEEYKNNASEAYKMFLANGIPPKYYALFETLNRQEAGKNIPDATIDGKTIGHEGYYLRKVPVQDELEAARAACFGKMTGCCQSLSGEAGQPCVIHGLTSPNGGFYVLCQGDCQHPNVTDKVVGQCWAWRSPNAIVFDSIEMTPGEKKDMVAAFYNHLGERLVLENHTEKVACGARSGISQSVGVTSVCVGLEQPTDYNEYRDSLQQRVIYDKNRPYLLYESHSLCNKSTHQFIEELGNSDAALADNKIFIEMLNYALLQSSELFQAIESGMKNIQKKQELDKIAKLMREYLESETAEPTAILEKLILHPALLNIIDKKGRIPLMRAVANGNVSLFFALIEDSDINVRDFHGNTPLILAAENGQLAVCNALIEKGTDVNAQNNYGHTPLMLALKKGLIDVCMTLINNGADVNTKIDNFGNTLLKYALKNGLIDICTALINKGADMNTKDIFGETPLMWALKNSRLEELKVLIDNGADVNAMDEDGEAPLMSALRERNIDVCKTLINKGADVNAMDKYGNTPLMLALKMGLIDVCKALINKGADINIKDEYGNTPLMWALKNNRLEAFKVLIDNGADVNTTDDLGQTPLMWALRKGNIGVCKALIDNGADVNAMDECGDTPLKWAAGKGNAEVCLVLKEALANLKNPRVNDALEKRLAILKPEARKPPLTPKRSTKLKTSPSSTDSSPEPDSQSPKTPPRNVGG